MDAPDRAGRTTGSPTVESRRGAETPAAAVAADAAIRTAGSAGGPEPELKRRIGTGLLTLYGIGVMVGAGIYVLVGTVAAEAGVLSPLTFVAAGLLAAPTALTYAELSGRIPESAGEAAFARSATGSEALALAVGLAIVAVGTTSAAAVLRGGVGYAESLTTIEPAYLTIGVGAALVALAVVGVLESLRVAAAFTVAEVIGLILVIWAGFTATPSSDWAGGWPSLTPWAGLGVGTVLAFFAFIGFEDMVNLVEEVKQPERAMPRAIIAALIVTSLLYAAVSIAAVRAVDITSLADSESPLVLVFETAWSGSWGSDFLAGIAVLAALNGVLAQIVMASRVLFGLGRTSPALGRFNRTHARFGTPVAATALVGAVVVVGALTIDLVSLAETTSKFLLAVFTAMNLALLVLKRRRQAEGFAVPTVVPVVGFVGSFAALLFAIFG